MTQSTKQSDIKRDWHLIDLDAEILGRVSSRIASLLMGKSKSYFVRNLDCGDFVVAINSKTIKVTGKKEEKKKYYSYSGYPGGLKVQNMGDLRKTNPNKIITHAVKGMLPQNKLRDRMMKRLFVFENDTHPYKDRFK